MPERQSSIHEVFGKNVDEETKSSILRSFEERFNEQKFERLSGSEREKTSEELQIISLVNERTNALRQKCGLESFNIPPKNIHVVSADQWKETKGNAFFSQLNQGVALKEAESKLVFAATVFHEMTHFKQYGSLHILKDTGDLSVRRSGWTQYRRSGEGRYFTRINEAIVEELSKQFILNNRQETIFKDEVQDMDLVRRSFPDAIDEHGSPILDDDTLYAKILGTKVEFVYKKERKILNRLIDGIYTRNQDEFHDREQVFDVFTKAAFTGEQKPIRDLIEQTFGPGTLAEIVRLEDKPDAQDQFINSLCDRSESDKPSIESVKNLAREAREQERIKQLQSQLASHPEQPTPTRSSPMATSESTEDYTKPMFFSKTLPGLHSFFSRIFKRKRS